MPAADEINSAEFNALKRTGKETKHIFGMDRSAIWENVNTTSKEQVSILLTSTRGNHDIKNTHKSTKNRVTNYKLGLYIKKQKNGGRFKI